MGDSGEEGAFAGSFYDNLRSMVTLVDHLRDAGLQNYIKLPRIVTLGTQSSGKSSVLESIVGLNFLPRNEGVCTRRPLELRLVHTYDKAPPRAKFEEVDKTFTDFNEVRNTIQRLTNEVAGGRKSIVDKPIIMTIYSSTCPDLTLIDLPGITRIPIDDQPQDIERITKEMAYRYISDPRTIILCVIAANADMTTSEGLQMARKVDKEGVRTIGVITKIDIMDRGTNAKRMIMGQEIPLRLGYVGVRNRSQQEINENVQVDNALKQEREYFSNHEIYSTLPPGFLGTETLANKLTKILFTHIKHFLPEILREVVQRIKDCDDRLSELGPSAPTEPRQKIQLLWNMITDFCEIFKNLIRGKYDRRRSSRITKDIQGGLVIKQAFNDLLKDFTNEFRATSAYSDEDIERAIMMHEGDSIPGFPSVDVFVYLIQPQLERLREPVIDCLQEIHSHLENLAHKIIERIFYRFPGVVSEICEVASSVLAKTREHCREITESLIDSEEGYIFTNDFAYLTQRTDIIPKNDARARDANAVFVNEVRSRIDAYFSLVIRNVRDSVPKVIGYFLVRDTMERMQLELYEHVNSDASISEALSEPSHISAERDMIKKQLATLRNAQKILKRDPSLSSQSDELEADIKRQEDEAKRKEEDTKRKAEDKRRQEEQKDASPVETQAPSAKPPSRSLIEEAPKAPIRQQTDTSLFGTSSGGEKKLKSVRDKPLF